ncbi:MAG: YjbF family lipoprotein [Gammaproteobacteria bacterium]|nr:YjbF family lipoprotein [Gammaproteobacteria bacterium]MBU2058461.1 YjbF family lipoprotein [Gammaproteobacteria bacterium]MBU2176486.1 YjbF family lipoprotein [Gammaproteobacteria bacterium]MBU2248572.1 YjbF family lipoprotein [Gammaproteobacteria bacterium]MBU2345565.1 YjbF family lipoprotein [Gammaproteobacteria bacterium]
MHKFIRFFVFFALASLVGCSSTFRTYTQTLELAFNSGEGASLTKAELAARESDALYAKVGTLPNAVLVLAYLEHGQYKWVSADDAMLVLEKGRVIKTTGFENDLLYLSDTALDPLKQEMAKIQEGQAWQSSTDWSGNAESGHSVNYKILHTEVASLDLLDYRFQTKLVTEQVTFINGDTAINQFWFDLNSGWLLKSRQTIAPFWPEVELVHISTAGRLLGVIKKGSLR